MRHPFWRKLVAVLLFAFALRLAAGWAWQARLDQSFGMGDSDGYWQLGLAIAQGTPYEYGAEHLQVFRSPGYPILLSPLLWLFGDQRLTVFLARAEAALFGTLAVAAVAWLARRLFDDRTALVAAALAAVYPGAILLSVLLLSEAPFCPLMLLNLALWIAAWQAPTMRRMFALAFLAGLAAAAATLMRPSWLLFTPFASLIGILFSLCPLAAGTTKGSRQGGMAGCVTIRPILRHLLLFLFLLLGLSVGMAPWWIRNACVTGRFVPTTLQVGASLYDGISPMATGASNMEFVPGFAEQERQTEGEAAGAEPFEVRLDHRMRDASLAWAHENPTEVARLARTKFLRMWNIWPNEAKFSSWPLRLVVLFTYTPILFFAIIGVWRTLRRGWPYVLCWVPAIYFTMLHVLFVSSLRYREPAMLALIVLAAGAMCEIRKSKTVATEN